MLDVDDIILRVDSEPTSVDVVFGLAGIRRSVCIHQMNRVNSRNGVVTFWGGTYSNLAHAQYPRGSAHQTFLMQ